MAISTPTLYLDVGTLQNGDTSPFITSLTNTTRLTAWSRVSGATGPLSVVLCTVSENTGTRVALTAGNTFHFTAKKDPSDTDLAIEIDFTEEGDEGEKVYTAETANLAVDTEIWGSKTQLELAGNFEERNSGGDVLRVWAATLTLARGNGDGGSPSPQIYVKVIAQTLTAGEQTQALTNLGGTTVGRAVFQAASASAGRTALGATTVGSNVFTAATAADARAAIGAAADSGGVESDGTITVANAGKVVVVTGLEQVGAGDEVAESATASTIAKRDSSGALTVTGSDTIGTVVVHDGTVDNASIGNLVRVSGSGSLQSFGDYDARVYLGLSETDTPTFTGVKAVPVGSDLKADDGSSVFTWGIGGTNAGQFNGPITFDDDVTCAGTVNAGSLLSAAIFSLTTGGASLATTDTTTVMTWGVSNSTTVTFAGTVEVGNIKAPTSGGGTIKSSNGTTCASWGAGGGGNFSVTSLTIASKAITLGGAFTTSGSSALTLTTTGTTNVTLPTSGTIPSSTSIWQNVRDFHRRVVYFNGGNMSSTTSGTGTVATAGMLGRLLTGPTTGTGAGTARHRIFGLSQVDQGWNIMADANNANYAVFDWAQEICAWGSAYFTVVNDNSFTFRITMGKLEADGIGDLASGRAGIQIKFNSGTSANLQLLVGSGTGAATTTTSTFAPTANTRFEWEIYKAAGSSTVTLYVNGTSVATNTNGPTGSSASSTFVLYQEELESTGSAASFTRMITSRGGMYGSEL